MFFIIETFKYLFIALFVVNQHFYTISDSIFSNIVKCKYIEIKFCVCVCKLFFNLIIYKCRTQA
jgi:hypothetical protein